MDTLTYCENCLENLDEDKFDYRVDFPVCHQCVTALNLTPLDEENE